MYHERTKSPRAGEELDTVALAAFLGVEGELEVLQFPAGHSNLTYLVRDQSDHEWVVRRPPRGANIKSGHDMAREFRVLEALYPVYPKVPKPVAFCGDEKVLGAQFYVMERVNGVILRGAEASGLTPDPATMEQLCELFVDNFVTIHGLDVARAEIAALGHPDGYIRRQVEGWSARYQKAKTDDIPNMEAVASWMSQNMPREQPPALIHNDYKYDNIVFSTDLGRIEAVLDWEMATLGDPLMDLGTTLAYWVEPGDPEFLQAIAGPTALPGNDLRQQLAQRYAEQSGRSIEHLLFYYVYGLFKIGVIGQQIYKRFALGLTKDPRFGALIFAVQAVAERAAQAIQTGKI